MKSQLRRRQDKEGEPRQNERHETQNRTQLQSELATGRRFLTMQIILISHQITKLIQVIRPGFQIYNLYISTFSVATKMIHADPVRSRLRNNTLQNLAGFRDAHPLKVSGNQTGNHIGDFIMAHLLSFVSPFQK